MRVVHRVVLVIALLGAAAMWLLTGGFNAQAASGDRTLLLFALPGIIGAAVVYPISWIFAGSR